VESSIGPQPFILLVNKVDLRDQWEIPGSTWDKLKEDGWTILETSAKTGDHVEEAFSVLTSRILSSKEDDDEADDD